MYILEAFTDTWNYTFVIVSIIAIIFGTIVTLRVNTNEKLERRRQKREEQTQEKNDLKLQKRNKKRKNV